jgi:two-component system CheB/CheR fusion protein
LYQKLDGGYTTPNFCDGQILIEASERFKKAKEFAEGIIDTVREALIVLDSELRVVDANPTFLADFQVSRDETERKFLYRIGNQQWNIPKLRALLEQVVADDTPLT